MNTIVMAVVAASIGAPLPKGEAGGIDWPQWRGPNRDGVSTETGLLKEWPKDGPKQVWRFGEAGAGYGGPAIAGGKIVMLGSDDPAKGDKEFAICLNAAKGEKLWRTEIETTAGDYLYQWGSGPRSTPTIDGEFVYVLGAKGDLLCLEMKTGKKVWSKNLVKDFGGTLPKWGYSESVLIDGNNVVCVAGGKKGAMIALKKATGETVWQSADLTDTAGYSSIVIADVEGIKHYVVQTMESVCGVAADNGKLLWRRADLPYRIAVIPTPIVHENHVFVTAGYGAGCALVKLTKKGTGIVAEKVYANKAIINHHGGVIRLGDTVYGHSDAGQWIARNMKDGEADPKWTSKSLDKGCITYADGRFYCIGEGKGTIVLADATAQEWKEHGRFELAEKSKFERRMGKFWTHPVVSQGRLYVRDHELLYSFDVKAK